MKKYEICLSLLLCVCRALSAQSYFVPQQFPGTSRLDFPYGVTSHITWYGYDYNNYRKCIEEIAECGVNVIRTDFNQASINWGKNNQDFSVWRNIVNTSLLNELKVSPLVYPSRYDKYTNKVDEIYTHYLRDCLIRYGHLIGSWEIWNEMDQMYASDGKAPAEEYVPLLASSYNTIKQINPNDLVLLGAIGDLNKPYFENLLAHGAADFYDITNLHFYSERNVPESIVPFYNQVHSLLQKYNVTKPLWLTETGYSTFMADRYEDPDRFYSLVLPKVYKNLNIKISNVNLAVLLDERSGNYLRNQDNHVIYSGFKGVSAVRLDDLESLSVNSFPILMILYGESFPMTYFNALESYVRRGGTVVFPEGGALLYFDRDLMTNSLNPVGKAYYKRLHIDCMFTWDVEAKEKGVKTRMAGTKLNPSFGSLYNWAGDDLDSPIYFSERNLSEGDVMMPIIEGYDESFSSPVAVCYKLNSDLKGNIIIQARRNWGYKVSESLQAIRYPRLFLLSFAAGVDKVFSYCLTDRSSENGGYGLLHFDLSRKPVFYSLKKLIEMCPSGSTRPIVSIKNHQYLASWIKPDGVKVYAIWTDRLGIDSSVLVSGKPKYYDCLGRRLTYKQLKVSPSVIYIEGAEFVSFSD